MAQKKRYAAKDISATWIAPEALRAERIQKAVDDGASAQEVADIASAPPQGEFREFLGTEIIEGREHAKLGGRLAWIHPQDADEGYYEHADGDDYTPVQTPQES
jgi:uncharacterized Fe-S cluster protein YjdI